MREGCPPSRWPGSSALPGTSLSTIGGARLGRSAGWPAVAQQPRRNVDPWEAVLDETRARDVLDRLGAHHRVALTLRYVDDLSVREVADHLDRTVHATEALLVRARDAFRRAYDAGGDDAD